MPKKKNNDGAYIMMEIGSLLAKIGFPVSLAELIIFMGIPFIVISMIWVGFGIFIVGKRKLRK